MPTIINLTSTPWPRIGNRLDESGVRPSSAPAPPGTTSRLLKRRHLLSSKTHLSMLRPAPGAGVRDSAGLPKRTCYVVERVDLVLCTVFLFLAVT